MRDLTISHCKPIQQSYGNRRQQDQGLTEVHSYHQRGTHENSEARDEIAGGHQVACHMLVSGSGHSRAGTVAPGHD